MKIFFITIVFVQTITLAFGQFDDTVYYHVQSKIKWDDFKGIHKYTGDTIKANLVTRILMRTLKVNIWTGIVTFESYAIALRNLSWVKADSKTDNVLRHEQLYFDISELFARKLETEINSKKINAARKNKINEIFNSYDKLLSETHKKYALETKLGTDPDKQKEWEDKIMAELRQFN